MPRRRVLLVEDSPTQAERLRSLIAAEDLDIISVQTAEAALELLKQQGADLVLLDFHLPGMNGNEFCREIRMNVNTRAIPVLMLTVEGSDAAQLKSLDSGADDYLPKSADPDVLRVRVRSLLRRSEGASAILEDASRQFIRARILAVDDSPSYLYLLARELKAEHYNVETVTNPLEALRKVEESDYDCVLVDFEMPQMDGAEVCRRIRQMRHPSDPELVLIMLTSHEDKEHMAMGFGAGADDYITKAADLAVTKARVRALLRRKFLVQENRRILNELKDKELQAIRARAEREAAELRAMMADQLAAANRELASANEKLDLANSELEQFAYSAAHDLQEPLRMMAMYSQLLQARYSASLDDTANKYITYCVEGSLRMRRLIDDLLTYARASGGEDERAVIVDINLVLDRALENLDGALREADAEVTRGPLPTLRVEEVRLQQVFQNLIGNAVKYRRENVLPRIQVSAERTACEWLFRVADNGVGIPPEYRETVFGVFKRLHGSSQAGTGLGLAICKRTIEQHGGRIWVESKPGEGAVFCFTVPAEVAEEPEDSRRALSSEPVI